MAVFLGSMKYDFNTVNNPEAPVDELIMKIWAADDQYFIVDETTEDAKARIELGKYEPVHGFVTALKKSNSSGMKCRIVQYSYTGFCSAEPRLDYSATGSSGSC